MLLAAITCGGASPLTRDECAAGTKTRYSHSLLSSWSQTEWEGTSGEWKPRAELSMPSRSWLQLPSG